MSFYGFPQKRTNKNNVKTIFFHSYETPVISQQTQYFFHCGLVGRALDNNSFFYYSTLFPVFIYGLIHCKHSSKKADKCKAHQTKTPFLYVSITIRVSFVYLLLFFRTKIDFCSHSHMIPFDGGTLEGMCFQGISIQIVLWKSGYLQNKNSAISNKFRRSLPWSRIAKNA